MSATARVGAAGVTTPARTTPAAYGPHSPATAADHPHHPSAERRDSPGNGGSTMKCQIPSGCDREVVRVFVLKDQIFDDMVRRNAFFVCEECFRGLRKKFFHGTDEGFRRAVRSQARRNYKANLHTVSEANQAVSK